VGQGRWQGGTPPGKSKRKGAGGAKTPSWGWWQGGGRVGAKVQRVGDGKLVRRGKNNGVGYVAEVSGLETEQTANAAGFSWWGGQGEQTEGGAAPPTSVCEERKRRGCLCWWVVEAGVVKKGWVKGVVVS